MAEDLLATAIANWGPRFTANGVDASDFQRITSTVSSWDDWCGAWTAAGRDYVLRGDRALAHGFSLTAGEFYARAATYFHFGKFLFVHDPEQSRNTHALAVAALNAALPYLSPPGQHLTIPFAGAQLHAIFRSPVGDGPFPTVILVPGLDSTKDEFREVEEAFLSRGMATLAVDGPGQGETEWLLPAQPEWEEVGVAIFDALARIPRVDCERVGAWGVSLGAFYVARLATADIPLRAVVALSAPFNFGDSWSHLNPLTQAAFRVRTHAATLDDAAERAHDFTLENRASRITAPLLVICGDRDRLFPATDGERLVAEAAGPTEYMLLSGGNHGCANVITQHRPYSADWMAQHLLHHQENATVKDGPHG